MSHQPRAAATRAAHPASRLPPAQTVARPPELALRAERFRLPWSRCELEYRLAPWRARPSCLARLEAERAPHVDEPFSNGARPTYTPGRQPIRLEPVELAVQEIGQVRTP